jgi:hypothetical protein
MIYGHPWAVASYSAPQGTPYILKPKIHHRVHKNPVLIYILNYFNTMYVHIHTLFF